MILFLKTTLVIAQVLFILHQKSMHTDFSYIKCYRMHSIESESGSKSEYLFSKIYAILIK